MGAHAVAGDAAGENRGLLSEEGVSAILPFADHESTRVDASRRPALCGIG